MSGLGLLGTRYLDEKFSEASEHCKRVITTDGAPAWGDGNDYGGRLIYLKGYRDGTSEERVRLLKVAIESQSNCTGEF